MDAFYHFTFHLNPTPNPFPFLDVYAREGLYRPCGRWLRGLTIRLGKKTHHFPEFSVQAAASCLAGRMMSFPSDCVSRGEMSRSSILTAKKKTRQNSNYRNNKTNNNNEDEGGENYFFNENLINTFGILCPVSPLQVK